MMGLITINRPEKDLPDWWILSPLYGVALLIISAAMLVHDIWGFGDLEI